MKMSLLDVMRTLSYTHPDTPFKVRMEIGRWIVAAEGKRSELTNSIRDLADMESQMNMLVHDLHFDQEEVRQMVNKIAILQEKRHAKQQEFDDQQRMVINAIRSILNNPEV